MHHELAFLKAKDSITIWLAPEFGIVLFTSKVNLHKKLVKVSVCLFVTLVNDSVLFPTSSVLSQVFKAATWHKARVWSSYRTCLYTLAWYTRSWSWEISIPLALLCCSMVLALSFHQVLHCNWGPGSKTAVTKSLQSWGIILLQVDHEFNICFTNSECMPYETITSLNLLKSNIATEV